MPAITYNDFSGGLDRRLPISVQEASRLWDLQNAYVTLGKRIKKRPGLRRQSGSFESGGSEPNYKGLFAYNGELITFGKVGGGYLTPSVNVDINLLSVPSSSGVPAELVDVVQAVVFQGFLYCVVLWRDVVTSSLFYKHQYLDGVTGIISDVNCPHSVSICVAAGRIFAIAGEVVRYCAAGDATDWTTANDAGFLSVSLQQNTTEECTAVGTYEDALVVYFPENAQIWDVAVDPSANQIRKRLAGVGTQAPLSQASFAGDLMFLSPFGFRSMRVQYNTDRIDDNDSGVAVDSLVAEDIAAVTDIQRVYGAWLPQVGQYWCFMQTGLQTSKAWVYTFSRSSKIGCWSEYEFPVVITGVASVRGNVYLRDDTYLYLLDSTYYTDDTQPIPVEVHMAFQDAKQPGVAKQFYGADYVVQGSPQVSFAFDPRDLDQEGTAMTIPGDTRPGDVLPVEMVCSAIAPIFRHEADEAFELDALTIYFHALTNFA